MFPSKHYIRCPEASPTSAWRRLNLLHVLKRRRELKPEPAEQVASDPQRVGPTALSLLAGGPSHVSSPSALSV